MNRKHRIRSAGFVALMSVIIISAFLLVMIFTLGIGTFFTRLSVLDTEFKRTSHALADACVNQAALLLAQNSSYIPVSGGDCVGVGDVCGTTGSKLTCKICQVSVSGSDRVVLARATYGGTYTNLRAVLTLSSTNVTVKDWKELGVYPGPTCLAP